MRDYFGNTLVYFALGKTYSGEFSIGNPNPNNTLENTFYTWGT